MGRRKFSSREIITGLSKHGGVSVGGKGSHTTLRYENPDTGEVRTVTVPKADPMSMRTRHDIADQAGANNSHEFCKCTDSVVCDSKTGKEPRANDRRLGTRERRVTAAFDEVRDDLDENAGTIRGTIHEITFERAVDTP